MDIEGGSAPVRISLNFRSGAINLWHRPSCNRPDQWSWKVDTHPMPQQLPVCMLITIQCLTNMLSP